MKRSFIATLLCAAGLLCTTVSSQAVGYIYFDNYLSFNSTGAPVWYGSPGTPAPVNSIVQIYYQLGTVAQPFDTGTHLATTTIGGPYEVGPGYFYNGIIAVPDYVSGPITFQTVAIGASSTFIWGKSQAITVAHIAVGPEVPRSLDIPSFTMTTHLTPIPEPSSLSLLGIALATFVGTRRK